MPEAAVAVEVVIEPVEAGSLSREMSFWVEVHQHQGAEGASNAPRST